MNLDGCWLWAGSVDPNGYGNIGHRGRAHRAIYEALVGEIPEGLVIDHLCRTPTCVNPDHLEPVTQGENIRRGLASARATELASTRTHCRRGHEYGADVRIYEGRKHCRECAKLNQRKYRLIRKRG